MFLDFVLSHFPNQEFYEYLRIPALNVGGPREPLPDAVQREHLGLPAGLSPDTLNFCTLFWVSLSEKNVGVAGKRQSDLRHIQLGIPL